MKDLIHTRTLEQITDAEFAVRFPKLKAPLERWFAAKGFAKLYPATPPEHTALQYLAELTPAPNTNGTWRQRWEVKDYTPEEIQAATTKAVQDLLDRTAQERRFDSIFTLCTYEGDPDPVFNAEGTAAKAWRSAVWAKCREIEEDVLAGRRPLPSTAQVLSELPVFTWPEV